MLFIVLLFLNNVCVHVLFKKDVVGMPIGLFLYFKMYYTSFSLWYATLIEVCLLGYYLDLDYGFGLFLSLQLSVWS